MTMSITLPMLAAAQLVIMLLLSLILESRLHALIKTAPVGTRRERLGRIGTLVFRWCARIAVWSAFALMLYILIVSLNLPLPALVDTIVVLYCVGVGMPCLAGMCLGLLLRLISGQGPLILKRH